MRILKYILVFVALLAAIPVDARFPRGTSSGGFNGGKIQTNVSALLNGGGFPFINQMKQAQTWSLTGGTNAPVTPDLLDSEGYPLATVGTGINTVFFVPTQAERPGNYVATWDGNGTIQMFMSNTLVSGSKTSSTGSGRYVFSTTTDRFVVGIETVGSPRITNLKVFHIDDEPAITAGEVFSSKFKAKLREGGMGIIRFLGWYNGGDGINTTNISRWSHRKPTGYVFYDGYEMRSGDYAGATSFNAATQAYSVGNTPNGFSLTDKATFHALFAQSYPATDVTFSNGSANITWASAHNLAINSRVVFTDKVAATAPVNFSFRTLYYVVSVPNSTTITVSATQGGSAIVAGSAGAGTIAGSPQFTMNVNGTGAKWVLNDISTYVTDETNTRPVANTFQSLATFVYDAGIDAYIKFGGDAKYNSAGLMNGVPPELMVRLAYEVGAHPWMLMPAMSLDPVTDYVPETISLVKNYPGASWMIPRFETANEIWNGAPKFFGTGFATAKAEANWPGTGASYMDWYGKATSVLGQTVANIYGAGGLGTAYHVNLGIQTDTTPSASNERATASKYVAQAAGAQSLTWSGGTINYTKSAASGWVSTVSPTNYISPSEYYTGARATRSAAFAGVRFTATITSGTMTVTGIDTPSGSLAIGKTIYGRGIANGALQSGITITGGSAPTWTLSSAITLPAEDTFYAATDMTQPALFVDSLGGASSQFNLAYINAKYVAWKAWGAGFGINKMSPYEGGYSPDFSSLGISELDVFLGAGKLVASSPGSATGLQGYTYGNSPSNYGNLVAAGGEFPSLFLPTGTYPIDNSWSVLDNIYQPSPPQWKASCAFNGSSCFLFFVAGYRRRRLSANDNEQMRLKAA